MNTDQMLKQLRNHPVMCEVGIEMVMGFPFFEVRHNKLYASFRPHREQKDGNRTIFFKPAYRIEFVYPFRHLCRFDNLVLEGSAKAGMPAICEEREMFDLEYARVASEIQRLSDLLLNETAQNGCPTDNTMTEYRQTAVSAINALGLSDIYASEVE